MGKCCGRHYNLTLLDSRGRQLRHHPRHLVDLPVHLPASRPHLSVRSTTTTGISGKPATMANLEDMIAKVMGALASGDEKVLSHNLTKTHGPGHSLIETNQNIDGVSIGVDTVERDMAKWTSTIMKEVKTIKQKVACTPPATADRWWESLAPATSATWAHRIFRVRVGRPTAAPPKTNISKVEAKDLTDKISALMSQGDRESVRRLTPYMQNRQASAAVLDACRCEECKRQSVQATQAVSASTARSFGQASKQTRNVGLCYDCGTPRRTSSGPSTRTKTQASALAAHSSGTLRR